jgi:predicted metalloprotease
LRQRFGASGDFAQAYVIAHEVGHHIQRLRGIEGRVRQAQDARPSAANGLSVRLETAGGLLCRDLGTLDRRTEILEAGDVDEALSAAASIGDDRIQRMSGRACSRIRSRTARPPSAWNGSSVASSPATSDACDTFSGSDEPLIDVGSSGR